MCAVLTCPRPLTGCIAVLKLMKWRFPVVIVFTVVLVTDVLLQLDHVYGTTYLPVCQTRKSAAHNSENNWKHSYVSDGLRRIVTFWLLRFINTRTYLLTSCIIGEMVWDVSYLCTVAWTWFWIFIARQHTDAWYWYTNSACPSVRLSLTFRYISNENGLTYRHSCFTIR